MCCQKPVNQVVRQFLEIHEILRRSQAPNKWAFDANYLLLCQKCHAGQKIAASNKASIVYQLALKKLRDYPNYNLQEWLAVRNPRAMEFITEAEIDECLKQLSTI